MRTFKGTLILKLPEPLPKDAELSSKMAERLMLTEQALNGEFAGMIWERFRVGVRAHIEEEIK